MGFYKLIGTPTVPVSLADAKLALRVDFTKDDALITDLIEAAVELGEKYTNIDFRAKAWEAYYLKPQYSQYDRCFYLPLEKTPLASLTSVEVSTNSVFAATTDYIHRESNGFDKIILTKAVALDSNAPYTFKVTFVSGYTTLPASIKTAILEHVSFLYENRGDAPSEVPEQIKSIYNRFKHIAGYA